MNILIYLLKASACTLAFYAVYRVFLSRLTFFGLNRWYLISTLALSFIIPAIHFSVTQQTSPGEDLSIDEPITGGIATVSKVITQPSNITNTWTLSEVLLYAYLIIAAALAIKLCLAITRLLVAGYQKGTDLADATIVKQNGAFRNSSFFHIIFLKNDLEQGEEDMIITHEKEHIKRLHSADNLLMELAKVVLWFNPVAYLYKKSVEQVHEYQVDAALTGQYDRKNYAGMLLKLSGFNAPALVNSFSGSQLNKRVAMLFSDRSKWLSKSLYALMAPVCAALVWFICVDHVYAQGSIPAISNASFTVVIDAGHGGKNSGGVVKGYTEKDLALSIAKAVKAAGDAEGMNIVLTRTEDVSMSVDERLSKKADLLMSLHVNSGPYDKTLNGILAITSPKANNTGSVQLASNCLAELGKLKGIAVLQKVQTQNIAVLRQATLPSALLELGYLTSANDLKFISDPANQAQMATAIVNGIKQYQAKTK